MEKELTQEQMSALHEGWIVGMVAEHARGDHAANGYKEMGCKDCLARNPICHCTGGPLNHRVSRHLERANNNG